ncbi:MAG: 6-phosphofructokinase, partial [Candidatus Korarchaeota archaeon]|nr:6-phosphofructokinase [Candidatus Korarchaeota archaeon]NIU82389.1 ATP-dependent 6-phosphofructokinase [Candidatus Thorarchaeota archaeon]NIW12862.1 ATP-dependent 6-phosphofructokinase [Candidatus Thorarchaeota archaeon]NIW51058.1 ATP-dependent 6-phosphofructokinase [Candidatus Korarchaeota archaeon]
MLRYLGVVTSGGDAPGMNAAIRAVVRLAYSRGFRVLGYMRGWEGLITDTSRQLTPRSVG